MGGVGLAFNGLHNNYVGENNIFLVTSKLQYQLISTLLEEQWFPFQKKNTSVDSEVCSSRAGNAFCDICDSYEWIEDLVKRNRLNPNKLH